MATIEGSAFQDFLQGTSAQDFIFGLGSADVVLGNDGDDFLFGGLGGDLIAGEEGSDKIFGQGGDDVILGGDGADIINAGSGSDYILGGDGGDIILGGEGTDVIDGGAGNDLLFGGGNHAFAVKPGPVDLGDFLSLVADALPLSLSSLIDRLIDALFAGSSDQKNREVAAAIVRHAAKRNGFVELIGGFDEGDLFLQGWSKDLPAGSNRVFVYDGTLKVADLTCCLGERKEAGGKVSGFFALMEAAETLVPETVQSVFFRGRNGWNKVDMHDRGSISQPRALPGHIRALLPRLSAGGEGRAKLERASWRFDGRDTVGELNVPVRIGVDFSIATDGAGVLLAGWLLDPEDHDLTNVLQRLSKAPEVLKRLSEKAVVRSAERSWDKSLQPFLRQLHTWFPERFQSVRRAKIARPRAGDTGSDTDLASDADGEIDWDKPGRRSSAR